MCLAYLAEANPPLVPVAALYKAVRQDAQGAKLSPKEFEAFLRHHNEIRVLEELDLPLEGELGPVAESLKTGPRAILQARIPTGRDATIMLRAQLDGLVEHVQRSLQRVREADDQAALDMHETVLARLRAMAAKLDALAVEKVDE